MSAHREIVGLGINIFSRSLRLLYVVIIVALILLIIKGGVVNILGDSKGYIEFAQSIISGELFHYQPLDQVTIARVIRTPGFPIVLAPWLYLFPEKIDFVLFSHLLIAIGTIVLVARLLQRLVVPSVSIFCTFLVFVLAHGFFWNLLTEWTSLNLLILLLATIPFYLSTRSSYALFLLFLECSAAVLVRPSFSILFPLLVILICLRPFGNWKKLIYASVGLIPLIAWMGFNRYYLGTFSLTPFGGYNFFANVSVINSANVEESDPQDLKTFITEINKKKCLFQKISGASEQEQFNALRVCYDTNMNGIARGELKPLLQMTFVRLNDVMSIYARRAVMNDLRSYFCYVLYLAWFIRYDFFLVILLGSISLFSKPVDKSLRDVGAAAMIIHSVNLCICCTLAHPLERYIQVTRCAMLLFVVLLPLGMKLYRRILHYNV